VTIKLNMRVTKSLKKVSLLPSFEAGVYFSTLHDSMQNIILLELVEHVSIFIICRIQVASSTLHNHGPLKTNFAL
jgi:lipoprotein signal peptidase